jgi:hypothetical protein
MEGLDDAIAELAELYSDRAAIDIHFKVYRVNLAGTAAQTEMYVDTNGKSAGARRRSHRMDQLSRTATIG